MAYDQRQANRSACGEPVIGNKNTRPTAPRFEPCPYGLWVRRSPVHRTARHVPSRVGVARRVRPSPVSRVASIEPSARTARPTRTERTGSGRERQSWRRSCSYRALRDPLVIHRTSVIASHPSCFGFGCSHASRFSSRAHAAWAHGVAARGVGDGVGRCRCRPDCRDTRPDSIYDDSALASRPGVCSFKFDCV